MGKQRYLQHFSAAEIAEGECHIFPEIHRGVGYCVNSRDEECDRNVRKRLVGDDRVRADHPDVVEVPTELTSRSAQMKVRGDDGQSRIRGKQG